MANDWLGRGAEAQVHEEEEEERMKPRDFESLCNRVIGAIETPKDLSAEDRLCLIDKVCAIRDGLTELPVDGRDLKLHSGACWITVGKLSVYVKRGEASVRVHVFPLDKEADDAIDALEVEYDCAPVSEVGV